MELKNCSFKPQVNKKSQKLAVQREINWAAKAQKLEEKAIALLIDKQTSEMKECTFIPKIYK